MVFRTDAQRETFLGLLGEVSETYQIEIHAYCLLSNQYHLLIRTPKSNLSESMRQLNSAYTQRYNASARNKGRLFRDRFKAVLIDPEHYIARVGRYIHLLPKSTHKTKALATYAWSSYPACAGKTKAPAWLHRTKVLNVAEKRLSAKQYMHFVEMESDKELAAFYGKKTLRSVLGSDDFIKAAKAGRLNNSRKRGVSVAKSPSLRTIMQVVAKKFGVEYKMLFQEMRGRAGGNTPRTVAMVIARTPGGYSLKAIAEALKVGDISTVSAATKRTKSRLAESAKLRRQVATIKSELFKT